MFLVIIIKNFVPKSNQERRMAMGIYIGQAPPKEKDPFRKINEDAIERSLGLNRKRKRAAQFIRVLMAGPGRKVSGDCDPCSFEEFEDCLYSGIL